MAVYRPSNDRVLSGYNPSVRISGQMVLTGSSPSFLSAGGSFFLEMLQVDDSGAGVTIADGNGVTIAANVKSFSQDQSPLRCDNGVVFTGSVILAKGFIIEGCL